MINDAINGAGFFAEDNQTMDGLDLDKLAKHNMRLDDITDNLDSIVD